MKIGKRNITIPKIIDIILYLFLDIALIWDLVSFIKYGNISLVIVEIIFLIMVDIVFFLYHHPFAILTALNRLQSKMDRNDKN